MLEIKITNGTVEEYEIEDWQFKYLKPIGILSQDDLDVYDAAVEGISTASLSEILTSDNINVFIWDKGFVCFTVNVNKECFVKAYYESRKAKYNKGQRKAFYEFLKLNNVKQIKALTIAPKKAFEGWGFKAAKKIKGIDINRVDDNRIEIIKPL